MLAELESRRMQNVLFYFGRRHQNGRYGLKSLKNHELMPSRLLASDRILSQDVNSIMQILQCKICIVQMILVTHMGQMTRSLKHLDDLEAELL